MTTKTKARGERGKYAEGKVHDFLKAFHAKTQGFDYGRIYDARSARGKFPARPGDFEFYRKFSSPKNAYDALHGLAEVKEVEHEFRLPSKNFDSAQIARLHLRQMAGGVIAILVCHLPAKVWRRVPLEFFLERRDAPSWDLTEFQLYPSAAEALAGVPVFS